MQLSELGANTSCADCPAYELNLCRVFTQVATEGSPAMLRPSERTIAARRPICREGELLEAVPIICKGWAASAITLPDGRRQILSFLLPGDIVSTAIIFDPISPCSVEAITEVHYRSFTRVEIKAALAKHLALFDKFSKVCIEEKARADHLAVDLGRRAANERISRLILNLLDRLTQRGQASDHVMDFPLRQHHIADATGLTVVHVSKVLSEFRRAGLVEINDRSLTVADPVGLRRLANMR